MQKNVIRDSSGKVINIGPWDYVEETVIDEVNGTSTTVQHNPLPDGATQKDEDIVETADGGYAAANP